MKTHSHIFFVLGFLPLSLSVNILSFIHSSPVYARGEESNQKSKRAIPEALPASDKPNKSSKNEKVNWNELAKQWYLNHPRTREAPETSAIMIGIAVPAGSPEEKEEFLHQALSLLDQFDLKWESSLLFRSGVTASLSGSKEGAKKLRGLNPEWMRYLTTGGDDCNEL